MKNSTRIAMIVEGTFREPQILNNLIRTFFKGDNYQVISLPAGENIYMLWKQLQEDQFETDIIEIVRDYCKSTAKQLEGLTRDDFAELFLFFDYDGHQNNLSDEQNSEQVLEKMLEHFDNETENGKLYVSYPMVEALRDYFPGSCNPITKCLWEVSRLEEYKTASSVNNQNVSIKDYSYSNWCEVLNVYSMRVSCLYDKESVMSFEKYREEVTPLSVFERQNMYIQDGKVFVLSAFPQFLLEYFAKPFWNSHVKFNSFRNEICSK